MSRIVAVCDSKIEACRAKGRMLRLELSQECNQPQEYKGKIYSHLNECFIRIEEYTLNTHQYPVWMG